MFRKRNERVDEEHVREDTDAEVGTSRADRARGLARGVATLIGAAGAGLLVWLATQVGDGSTGGYWTVVGLLAAAGLSLALSQLLGGWTKWGWPRLSAGVFLLGFLPALIVGGWLLLGHQPDANWFRTHVLDWSNDAGIEGLVEDLGAYLPVVAFGLGLLFGFTFDTTGPRVREERVSERRERRVEPTPVEDRSAADEPITAERRTTTEETTGDETEAPPRRRLFERSDDDASAPDPVAADRKRNEE